MIKKKSGLLKSSAVNLILKPIGMIISFLYTPILLSYLGDENTVFGLQFYQSLIGSLILILE